MKPASLIAALFLAIIALAHLLRIFFQVPVVVGTADIPVWISIPGIIGPGALAAWLFWERKQ